MAILLLVSAGCQRREDRFDALYQRTTAGNVTETASALKPFYPELVEKLSVGEFLKVAHIVAEHGHWYAARQLAPYLGQTQGERRLLVAVLVATLSHGNHPDAMRIVERPEMKPSSECEETIKACLLQIGDLQEQWDREDPERLGIPRQRWQEMSKEERWKVLKDSDAPG